MSDLNALNLEPGTVVGGYTLVSRLGSGAMGSVWRVRDDGGATYAMKILRDSLADESATGGDATPGMHDPDLKANITPRERLRREAMALKKVSHPGVCGIVDMELDDTLAFIVTELIEGRNLRDDVAANGRYLGDDLERLARKLIDATKAVHAAGIVHRDIKPTNVMVSAHGPVLVDFGIAMGEGESHVTRTGLVMGTPGFIAPEIIDGAESDETTDWWSVASVLAFASTGAPVFGTKPMMAVLERAASGNANLTGLPAGTLAAFRSALNPDRTKRCTPDQLLHAIALDTLNPAAWQSEQGGLFAGASGNGAEMVAGATEVMPPFGANGCADYDNPRIIWRQDDDADIIRTEALAAQAGDTGIDLNATVATKPTSEAATVVFPAVNAAGRVARRDVEDAISRTATGNMARATVGIAGATSAITAVDAAAAATQTLADVKAGSTQVLTGSTTPLSERTAILPAAQPVVIPPAQNGWNQMNAQPTAVNPAIRPAMQRVIDQTAQSVPTEAMVQANPAPNPADVRRGAYLKRGTLPLVLLAVPLAALAANAPLVALIAAAVLLWLLLTLAYNTESQLEREGRRGGQRKGSDSLIRAASLPWHAIKALLTTIPRLMLIAVIALAGTVAAALLLGLPVQTISWSAGGWMIPIPLLFDAPASISGLTLGGFMAVGWLISVFGPQSMMLRLGAGSLRGLKPVPPANQPQIGENGMPVELPVQPIQTIERNRRGPVLFTIWLIATLALCAIPLFGMPINWMPLI